MAISNVDHIDAIAKTREGQTVLAIIDAEHGVPEDQRTALLQQKIDHYAKYLASDDFRRMCPEIEPNSVTIVVLSVVKPAVASKINFVQLGQNSKDHVPVTFRRINASSKEWE